MSAAHYPSYLPRQYRRARLGILILALLGLMSFVAIRDIIRFEAKGSYTAIFTQPTRSPFQW